MIDTVEVIMCPQCGDTWATEDKDITKKECLCFRCGCRYIPEKVIKMWNFAFKALKRTKG